jgi:hypothetical protein
LRTLILTKILFWKNMETLFGLEKKAVEIGKDVENIIVKRMSQFLLKATQSLILYYC